MSWLSDGYTVLTQALSPTFVRAMLRAFVQRYGDICEKTLEERCLRVGPGRFMQSLDFEPPFSDPQLYANPQVFGELEKALGPGFLINNISCVVAYPGAGVQHIHRDHPHLFREETDGLKLPTYAVTAAFPLVDLSERTGATRLWPRSERHGKVPRDDSGSVCPLLKQGDVLLFDYRLWHQGTPNRGQVPRPIVYVGYSRPWFRDSVNFYKQSPLAAGFEKVPEHLRPLFAAAKNG